MPITRSKDVSIAKLALRVVQSLASIFDRTLSGKIAWEKRTVFLYEQGGIIVQRARSPRLGIRRHQGSTIEERMENSKNDPEVVEIRTGTDCEKKTFFIFFYRYWNGVMGLDNADTLFVGTDPDELRSYIVRWHSPKGRSDFKVTPSVSVCDSYCTLTDSLVAAIKGAITEKTGGSLKRNLQFNQFKEVSEVLLRYARSH